MAEGNFQWFNNGKLQPFTSGMASVDVAVALLSADYTPDPTHSTWGDVSAHEIGDADYAQQSLPGASYGQASGTVTYDADPISFGDNVTITAKYAVFVRGTPGSLASGDTLIGYVDLDTSATDATVSSKNSEFKVNSPSGIFEAS